MKKITLLILTMFCFSFGFSQTFTDSGGPYDIQNGNGTAATCGTAFELNLPLAVAGVGTLGGVNSIESVTINVTHTWNSDVKVSLQDPSGTLTQLLVQNIGGSGDGFVDCVLIDSGSALPTTATTPVTGSFAPLNELSAFNSASTIADGEWVLVVCDDAGGDVGTVDSWSITFVPTPTGILDYYNLQWPPNGTINPGAQFDVYAQAYEAGLTDVTTGQAPGIASWIGYSRTNTNPNGAEWTWVPATFHSEQGGGNNDQYILNLGALATSGTYYYASRWSLENGPYTYGGIQADGTYGGVWGAENNISGVLMVNAPSNDECANATMLTVASDLTCTSPVSGTTTGATQSLAGCTGTANDDVWYSFVATSSAHTITITNTSGATDIVTEVFDSCGGASLLCQDTPNSPVTVGGLVPSNTYYFRIYTASATETVRTSFDVCVGTPPAPPVNDSCATATVLTVGSDLSCSNPVAGTTINATQSLAGCSGTADDDVWYAFVASGSNHTIIVNNTGGSSDIITQVLDSCGGVSLICQDSPDSPINLTGLIPSNTYYFRIYTWSGTSTVRTSFTVCVGTPPAPPANDECAGALPLTESADSSCANAVSGTTVSATPSASGTCSTSGKDVWYMFTPSQTASYVFNVTETEEFGSTSTYVSVYSGSCGTTTQVGTGCSSSTVTLDLTAATEYYVVVRSTSSTNSVNFDLCVYPEPAPPANDECAGALPLTESADSICTNAVSGTTVSAGPTATGTCSASGKDVWYAFTPSQTANYVFQVAETQDFGSSSTSVSVYSGSCGTTTQVNTGCTSSATRVALTAGTPYYVVVRSTSATAGVNFNLCAYAVTPPANDACSGAIALTPGVTFEVNPVVGTTSGATGSGELPVPGCASYDPADTSGFGGDLWYSVTVPADGNLTIEINGNPTGASGDSGMAVYTGTCGALTLFECDDDDSADGLFSLVSIESTDNLANQTVFVRVWEWGGDAPLNFQVSAYNGTLSVVDVEQNDFTYFPNPVKNTLNLKAQSAIQNVSIYNMLGQEVLRTSPNTLNSEVDMASLQTGAYFIKVTINGATETIRVIKQ